TPISTCSVASARCSASDDRRTLTDPAGRGEAMNEGVVVGVDMGGTKILGIAYAASAGGPLVELAEHRMPTPVGTAAVLDALTGVVDVLRQASELDGRTVASVGLGVPGLVDREGTLRF